MSARHLLPLIAAFLLIPRASAQAVVQAEPIVVSETPLASEAGGVTQVRTAAFAPLAQRDLTSLSDTVANLHINSSGAGGFGSLVSLRGLSNTPYFSDPSVAVYFDDLPLGNAFTFPTELLGFSSVTVSRGPQPAGSGRSGEAGLIAFSSGAPGPAASGSLRAAIGNYASHRGAVELSTARGERADATIAAGYSERDGYITNTQLGTRVDDQQAASLAARVRVRPSQRSEIAFQLLLNRHRDGAQPLVPIGGPLFTVARGREGQTDSDFAGGAVKLSFDTDLGRLSATTSRTRWTLDPYDNRLVLPPPLDSRLTQTQSAWNEELRFSSVAAAPIRWHAGAWFSEVDTTGDVNRAIPGLFPIEGSSFDLTARTAAAFGELTAPLGAGWELTGALRAERVRKEFDRRQTIPSPGHYTASASFDGLLPEATLAYALNRTTHATLSVGTGTKPGGWSAYTDNPSLARFQAEDMIAYEAGIDTTITRSLTLAARVFDYEIRRYQIERSFNATDYLVVNAPRARSTGAELEASWRSLPGWTFTASLGVTDTTLREFVDPFTGSSYAGNRAPYTPDYDAHLSATYRDASGWFATASATAVGRTYYEESEATTAAAPAHTTVDAELGYEASQWRVALYGQNLTDARYATLVIPGIGHQVPGAPRTYGVEAAWKW